MNEYEQQQIDRLELLEFEIPKNIDEARAERLYTFCIGSVCLGAGAIIIKVGSELSEYGGHVGDTVGIASASLATIWSGIGFMGITKSASNHLKYKRLANELKDLQY
jgi:hypothetical protein